ncbi:MAG: hypothetical protein DWQ01_11735 [Planctomycetota bacterium]|nr:MAG: hypothetical protein DWQ01_11735 [Planctomycetota bacterium]
MAEGREGAYILYDSLLYTASFLLLPWLLLRWIFSASFRTTLPGRLGAVSLPSDESVPTLLLHGVSVGEVKAMGPLVDLLKEEHPNLALVLSTTTAGGRQTAKQLYPDLPVVSFPVDLPFACRRFLRRVKPCAVLLMELEIWPNFLRACSRSQVPVAIINGRITERSRRRYLRVQRLLPQFDRIALYGVQNHRYADRFRSLDVPVDRIVTTGNLKYDNLPQVEAVALDSPWPGWLAGQAAVAVGSTHPPEEVELIAEACRRPELQQVVWLVVPRHPHRAGKLIRELEGVVGDRPLRLRSRLSPEDRLAPGTILVVDTFGELEKVYAAGCVAVVGGSLIPHGGQNVLEPAALGRPVVVGPYTENFEEEVSWLAEAGGLERAQDAASLLGFVARWLQKPDLARQAGAAGCRALDSRRGAARTTLTALENAALLP